MRQILESSRNAIQTKNVLRHPAVFISYGDLRPLGGFVQHEEVRSMGVLHVVDTYEMLLEFTQKEITLFVSQSVVGRRAMSPTVHLLD